MVKQHATLMLLLLRAADMAAAACAWVVAYCLRVAIGQTGIAHPQLPAFADFIPAMVFSLVLTALLFGRFGLYEPKRITSLATELADLAKAIVILWGMTWLFANFLRHVTVSRVMMLSVLASWLVIGGLERMAGRAMVRALRRRGYNMRRAAIVGAGRLAQTLFHSLRRNRWTGIEPACFVAGGTGAAPSGPAERSSLLGLPLAGRCGDIQSIIAQYRIDIVFVALPAREHKQARVVLDGLSNTQTDVRVVPDLPTHDFLRNELALLDDLPVVRLTHTPLSGVNQLIKRVIDVIVSAAALIVLALPMAIVALLVRLSGPGPIFYRQVRAGLAGRPFKIIKFRSMVADAENATGPVFAWQDDPRVTPIGRFLRRTGLDELPQLFNVLIGDMTLVGPRPERPELIERFRTQIPRYMLRHHVKAGLTGWAQIHGLRGRTSLRKRIRYDTFYICRWSLWLDLRILLQTAWLMIVPARRTEAPSNPPGGPTTPT